MLMMVVSSTMLLEDQRIDLSIALKTLLDGPTLVRFPTFKRQRNLVLLSQSIMLAARVLRLPSILRRA